MTWVALYFLGRHYVQLEHMGRHVANSTDSQQKAALIFVVELTSKWFDSVQGIRSGLKEVSLMLVEYHSLGLKAVGCDEKGTV